MWSIILKYYFKLKKDIIRWVLVVFMSIAIAVLNILIPVLSGNFLNIINISSDSGVVMRRLLTIAGCMLSVSFLTLLNNKATIRLKLEKIFAYYFDSTQRFANNDLLKIESMDRVYLNERLISDCSNIMSYFLESIIPLGINIIMYLIAFFLLLQRSLLLAIIVILYSLSYLIVFYKSKYGLSKVSHEMLEVESEFYSDTTREFTNLDLSKTNNLLDVSVHNMSLLIDLYKSVIFRMKCSFISFDFKINIVNIIAQLLVFIVYLSLYTSKKVEIGAFVTFGGLFGLISTSLASSIEISKLFQIVNNSAKRMKQFESDFQIKTECKTDLSIIRDIELIDVSFIFPNGTKLSYPNMRFSSGINLIKGKNGSGKTTLLKVIQGLYPPTTGCIKYNAINYYKKGLFINSDHLFAHLPQEPDCYFTLLSYLKYREYIDYSIAKDLQILPIIQELNIFIKDFNYDYVNLNKSFSLMEELSVGTRKKILLLCYLSENKNVLLLDELENHLDQESLEYLINYLNMSDKITIIVTHSPIWEGKEYVL